MSSKTRVSYFYHGASLCGQRALPLPEPLFIRLVGGRRSLSPPINPTNHPLNRQATWATTTTGRATP